MIYFIFILYLFNQLITTSLTINEIPNYLMNSELYKNIESDESFDVQGHFECLK